MQRLILASLLLLFSVALEYPVFAVGIHMNNNQVTLTGFGEVNVDKTLDAWSKSEREKIEPLLNLQVDLLCKVCELNEKETKKLRIAVKGVVSKRLSHGRMQMEAFIYSSKLAKPTKENVDLVSDVQLRLKTKSIDVMKPYAASETANGVVTFWTYFEEPVEDHPMMAKMMKKILSEEQRKIYEEHLLERNMSIVDAAVSLWVVDQEATLFLSKEQREKISQQAKDKFYKKVTLTYPVTIA